MLVEIAKYISDILVRLPFWAVLSLPIFLALLIAGLFLKKHGISSISVRVIFGLVSAFLLFPMPMGIFVVFVPNVYLLYGGFEYYVELWIWTAGSFSITAIVSCSLAWLTFKLPNKSIQPTGHASR